jgi:rRNA maturation endonuclease Nob1
MRIGTALTGEGKSSLDPREIKRVKVYPVKCPKCKLTAVVKATVKVCPVCGGPLPSPGKQ